jgi:hypothetical protein
MPSLAMGDYAIGNIQDIISQLMAQVCACLAEFFYFCYTVATPLVWHTLPS